MEEKEKEIVIRKGAEVIREDDPVIVKKRTSNASFQSLQKIDSKLDLILAYQEAAFEKREG